MGAAALSTGCKGSRATNQPIPATAVPPAVYGENSLVTDEVRAECAVLTEIPEYIVANAPGATLGGSNGADRVLSLEITYMMGPGGGSWSGPKHIIMEGTLTDSGQTIGTFRVKRTNTGKMWAFDGTCSLLQDLSEELGEDIGQWLHAPTMDALLGELEP